MTKPPPPLPFGNHRFVFVNEKRCTAWELQVKFYLGQNEDCSLGDSTSERLLQRGSGGRSIYKVFEKGEFKAIKRLLYKRFSASHKELMSSRRDLVIF